MKILTVTEHQFELVLPLIAGYQRFYEKEPNDAANRAHFGQFLDCHDEGILFAAIGDPSDPHGITGSDDHGPPGSGSHGNALSDDQAALGFATLYFPFSSTLAARVCLMNDLFTVPEARGQGVGRALIQHCAAYAKEHGFDSLRWQTALDNKIAQRLYDKMTPLRSGWYTYIMPV